VCWDEEGSALRRGQTEECEKETKASSRRKKGGKDVFHRQASLDRKEGKFVWRDVGVRGRKG